MKEETYSMFYLCKNCLHRWTKKIEKGQRSPEATQCPNCDCLEGYVDFVKEQEYNKKNNF